MRQLHYLEAERALLSRVLLGGEGALARITLDERDCFDPRHRRLLAAMRALHAKGQPCTDVQLLAAEFGSEETEAATMKFLHSVPTASSSPGGSEHYEALIRRAALTRNVLLALSEAQGGHDEGDELLGRLLSELARLARLAPMTATSVGRAMREAARDLVRARDSGRPSGLRTGFDTLDRILGGIQPGVVTILAGRPSMGKSALARTIAKNVSAAGEGVHVFSPEDSRRTYALRTLADDAHVPLEAIRSVNLADDELHSVLEAADRMPLKRPWLIDDTASPSSGDIAARVRRHREENKTALVVVDYAQLIRERDVPVYDKRMQTEVAAENLVALARSEGVAVLLLSQLSRECEKRDDKRPMLSDLRETGALEQVAEAVLFVFRPEIYGKTDDNAGVTEIIARKNKNGRTGTARLAWDAKYATHRPLATGRENQDREEN